MKRLAGAVYGPGKPNLPLGLRGKAGGTFILFWRGGGGWKWHERIHAFTFLTVPLIQSVSYFRYLKKQAQDSIWALRRWVEELTHYPALHCGSTPISPRRRTYMPGSAFFHGSYEGKRTNWVFLWIGADSRLRRHWSRSWEGTDQAGERHWWSGWQALFKHICLDISLCHLKYTHLKHFLYNQFNTFALGLFFLWMFSKRTCHFFPSSMWFCGLF